MGANHEFDRCLIDGGPTCVGQNCSCDRRFFVKKRVRVVGTDLIFPNKQACARYFRVSVDTVSMLLEEESPLGDVNLEWFD